MWSGAKVGILNLKKPGKNTQKIPTKKCETKRCANVGRASRKDEKLLNTPAKQDSSPQTRRDKKGATSDPHDEMAPQKILSVKIL